MLQRNCQLSKIVIACVYELVQTTISINNYSTQNSTSRLTVGVNNLGERALNLRELEQSSSAGRHILLRKISKMQNLEK